LIAAISENLMAAFFLALQLLPLVAFHACHPAHERVSSDTQRRPAPTLVPLFSIAWLWLPACFSSIERPEAIMEAMLQGLVIVGGLTFSLAVSLLIEELIFGQIVRTAFARRPEIPKAAPKY
jgi:hypothetical protein